MAPPATLLTSRSAHAKLTTTTVHTSVMNSPRGDSTRIKRTCYPTHLQIPISYRLYVDSHKPSSNHLASNAAIPVVTTYAVGCLAANQSHKHTDEILLTVNIKEVASQNTLNAPYTL